MTPEQRDTVVMAPLRIWAGLIGLLILTIGYAYAPHLPLKTEAGLAIAVAKALLIAILFMQLRSAAGIVRFAAVAGVVWASFLFLFTFADLLTR
jgi:cytochrome c oxidase subunit 4